MDNNFELPVRYKGRDLLFPAQWHQYRYGLRIEVSVDGKDILFERDEEMNWRAIVGQAVQEDNRPVSSELLQAMAESIETILDGRS